MESSSVRPTDSEINHTVNTYADSLFRLCFSSLQSTSDAEDAVSETFLKYMTKAPLFTEEEHRKAWLIKVAVNICRDIHRSRKKILITEECEIKSFCPDYEKSSILQAVMSLPLKYKTVIHLYYMEGYKTDEIAHILSVSPAAVRKRLEYGRKILKEKYQEEL
jgi:RNA polymerase sigma factor (sigma-70 family)